MRRREAMISTALGLVIPSRGGMVLSELIIFAYSALHPQSSKGTLQNRQ